MAIIFLTGLSGVGKSSALAEMKIRGYNTLELDDAYMTNIDGERLIDEEKLQKLLDHYTEHTLILAGTESNQGHFYDQFNAVILLDADLKTMLERIKHRTNNPFGKSLDERQAIIEHYDWVLPLLKNRADRIINTEQHNITEVCDIIESYID